MLARMLVHPRFAVVVMLVFLGFLGKLGLRRSLKICCCVATAHANRDTLQASASRHWLR